MPSKIVEQLIGQVETLENEMAKLATDIAWIKKAFWTLAGAGLTFNVTLAAGILLYLLKR